MAMVLTRPVATHRCTTSTRTSLTWRLTAGCRSDACTPFESGGCCCY
jgi:hypothetical protein